MSPTKFNTGSGGDSPVAGGDPAVAGGAEAGIGGCWLAGILCRGEGGGSILSWSVAGGQKSRLSPDKSDITGPGLGFTGWSGLE